jgi:hypothetical protein
MLQLFSSRDFAEKMLLAFLYNKPSALFLLINSTAMFGRKSNHILLSRIAVVLIIAFSTNSLFTSSLNNSGLSL